MQNCCCIRESVIQFGLDNVSINMSSVADEIGKSYMTEVSQVLMSSLKKLCEPNCTSNGNHLTVFVTTIDPFADLKLSTNESYGLNISTDCK